ncbi:MAG: serine hydrolase [Erythrobacter sp.]|jgi:beta-lactamase class A|nr:serine hydrolase [Erythrobacter sp.]
MIRILAPVLASVLAALLAVTLMPEEAAAQSSASAPATPLGQRAQDLVEVMNGTAVAEEVFTPDFLAAIPYAQIEAIAGELTDGFGPATGVEGVTPRSAATGIVRLRLERGIAEFSVSLDPAQGHRINGLRVEEVTPVGDTPADLLAELQALPGDVSAYFGPLDGAPGMIALDPEAQMPLGSTMKLYVLAQLGREIATGQRAWGDVVRLDQRSYPSGQLQDWPLGTPVTLHTLASLMISISDNTATDQLIRVLGQEAMADILRDSGHTAPRLNAPWLTTRELFQLKGGNRDRRRAYVRGDAERREQILAGIKDDPVSLDAINAALASGPVALEIEWFASTADLARLFRLMRDECDPAVFEIMAINPNATPAARSGWNYVGYKGGSEPGVLNLTWLLTDSTGRDWALALSWSNPDEPVDESRLNFIGQRILSLGR